MTLKLKEPLKEYESDIRELYEDLDSSLDNKEALLSEIELIWYSRYGIVDEDIVEIDRKYLPTIYQKIKSVQPDIAEYFKAKMIAAGVSPTVFS
ncbi:hypothetical protein [Desulfurobacterium sp.]